MRKTSFDGGAGAARTGPVKGAGMEADGSAVAACAFRRLIRFCRDLALQRPLLSGLGGGLGYLEHPDDLYRRAARRTLEQVDGDGADLGEAIASLLLLRDNDWQEMEELLVKMLGQARPVDDDFVVGRAAAGLG